MMPFEPKGCTDITGFGLAGHALGMARASRAGIRFFFERIPRFPDTLDLIGSGVATGVTQSNAKLAADSFRAADGLADEERFLFFDPQTSGGLLIPVRSQDAEALVKELQKRGVAHAAVVGEVFATDTPCLEVVR
jgi:selenide,water dikinase